MNEKQSKLINKRSSNYLQLYGNELYLWCHDILYEYYN